jgi:tetratricopeptide (TPR) repeat protein
VDGVERGLLFGALALRQRLIDEAALKAAVVAWQADPSRSLPDHLEAGGLIDGTRRRSLDALVTSLSIPGAPGAAASLHDLPTGDARSVHDRSTSPAADRVAGEALGAVTSTGERFEILKPHARGGLGAVYVALDRELNREVALKQIVEARADDLGARRRFLLEAEITGRLEHPGIVPVYGLGVQPDGRPFYAMRFVRGTTLDEAIRAFHADARSKNDPGARALALQKLLRRFLDVCNAIAFAHERGVLHRDIKPRNIIVGSHGETLVVDWGLAKALGGEEPAAPSGEGRIDPATLSGTSQTIEGSALGTLGYMSPEQARGDLDVLGPATDVYSLGATLSFLLAGEPGLHGDARALLAATLKGDVPGPRQIDPSVDRALDAVCRKAMAFDAKDRYATARALADDVERWLADEPVTAYRDPLLARAMRWARRHRTAAAGAGALLATAVVALSLGTVLVNRERARAEAGFRQARAAVDDYFTTVSESRLLDVPGMQPLRLELLNAAAKYYGTFVREHGHDPAVRKEAAAASFRLAWVTRLMGRPAEAVEPARTALALYEDLTRSAPADPEFRQQLARCHGLMALLESERGRQDEAIEEHRKALAIREALARERPDDPIVRNDVVRTHSNIAGVLREVGRPLEALASYETAAALGRELLAMPLDRSARQADLTGQKGPWAVAHYEVALVNRKRAAVLRDLGRLEEADKAWRESLVLFEELVREFPDELDHRSQLAECHLEAAKVLEAQGRTEEALQSLRRALDIKQDLAARNPALPGLKLDLGRIQLQLAGMLSAAGRNAEALAGSRQATDTFAQLVKDSPGERDARTLLAQSLRTSAEILIGMGRNREALPLLERGRGLLEAAVQSAPGAVFPLSNLAVVLGWEGRAHAGLGHVAQARELLGRAAGIVETLADRYPSQRYNQACFLALVVPLADPDAREAAAARAMDVLRQAVDAGYGDAQTLETDRDLDSLRNREDFRKVLSALRQKTATTR